MENLSNRTNDGQNLKIIGLTAEEVLSRRQQGLTNKVKRKASKSYLKIFIDNFCTFFNLLCFACFFVLLSVAKDTAISNYFFVILFVANSVIGTIQEIRAKLTVERLSLMKAPTARVLRGGEFLSIPVEEVVLDDVIELSLGSQIPADCVVLEGFIDANESLLTGESVAVRKNVGDKLLSGSFVTGGKCLARAEKVGADSYLQTLSQKAKEYQKTNSKLLNALNAIIKTVSILIVPIAIGTFLVQNHLFESGQIGQVAGKDPTFSTGVVIPTISVIIGMIPCGMFFLTTLSLAVGIIKLSKLNTLVQDMYSLEMLARSNVLCLDKTGTITDGRMTVKEIVTIKELSYPLADVVGAIENALDDSNQTAEAVKDFCKTALSPTLLAKIPFSSKRKFSAVTFEGLGTFVMGAPDYVMDALPEDIDRQIKAHMSVGRRVLLVAQSNLHIDGDDLPEGLSPCGLVVLEDNVRPEAIETIRWFKENDVKIRVISGDDPMTVSEIAKRAGIEGYDKYVNLYNMSDEEVMDAATKYVVFGRVSPEQKALIVKALKAQKNTVAMTGDGVNDILAMKEADCSITVASGSGAARSLAHLVLLDDNFNSLPQVVKEGRRVVNNIQQSASLYLMKTLFTMIFAIISIASVTSYPFSTGMMLMLEFFIIGVPSVMLSLQPSDKRITGNFIKYVLSHAVPGATILIFNAVMVKLVYTVPTLTEFFRATSDTYSTLATLVLTLGGWVFLVTLCYPFNKFRGGLCIVATVVIFTICTLLVSTSVLFGFFQLQSLVPLSENLSKILLVIGLLVVDFPLLLTFKWLIK